MAEPWTYAQTSIPDDERLTGRWLATPPRIVRNTGAERVTR